MPYVKTRRGELSVFGQYRVGFFDITGVDSDGDYVDLTGEGFTGEIMHVNPVSEETNDNFSGAFTVHCNSKTMSQTEDDPGYFYIATNAGKCDVNAMVIGFV